MSAFAEMNSIFTHRNSLLAQNSVLAGFVESKFEFVRRLDRSRTTETTLSLEEKLAIYKSLLVAIQDLCTSHGADLAIVFLPGYTLALEEDHARWTAMEFAREHQVRLLDLNEAPLFQQADAETTYGVGDKIHLNKLAHQEIAEYLQIFLAETLAIGAPVKSVAAEAESPRGRQRN